ncbi:MAG TPA: DinB family protein [Saprospiraceae bacterium]|nr:DinB family protein [Saprospiraceae bacterium]
MNFDLNKSIQILERTPSVLESMLDGLSDPWTMQNEGPETWSPFDVVGHFIHGEKTDWMPRLQIILSDQMDKQFVAFDRFAQYENSKGKTLQQLLREFRSLREENLRRLKAIPSLEDRLSDTGIHPEFGEVTLAQLLSTWVVHDLNHIAQIARVMAKQYKEEVGPWIDYLGILRKG